jgi:hypothetical protein
MASGIFSTSTLGTGWSLVAAGAATANRIVTVSFTTRQTEVLPPFGKISLAIVPKGNLISADNEYIEFDSAILPGSIVEKTGIIISPDYDLILHMLFNKPTLLQPRCWLQVDQLILFLQRLQEA